MDPLLNDNLCCIQQGIDLVSSVPSDVYTATSEPSLGASIGGHIRHNIDHYNNFIANVRSGSIDYDARHREPELEQIPKLAVQQLRSIAQSLVEISQLNLDEALQITTNSGSTKAHSQSTIRRELQFLLSHSIHHYAIIAMICRMRQVEVPTDFGVAPSTLEFRQQPPAPCAH